MIKLIILCAAVYLAGSVNFAILLFKITGKGDPRKSHSGNAGTTNVYRQAGKFWAALILLLDAGRAVGIAVLCIQILKPELIPLAGFFLVLGNRYPCFHNFSGGKGVANYLGFTLIIAPLWTGIAAAAWVIGYLIKRVPFIASFFMIAILAAGTIIAYKGNPIVAVSSVVTAFLIIYNHKKNIIEYRKKKK